MSAEYVDDLPYVRQFVPDLTPARLRLVAALNGLTPPPDRDFDYCELGCGHGDTLVALAAAHPESRFLGVDLSAAHVASAKRLARDGALDNVGVLERDFSTLVHEDTGELDYIVAHGVLSWISPEKRKSFVDFAAAKLKPGGLLYVSYNAMPGWASVEPLRQLLLFGAATAAAGTSDGEPTTLERARRGLAFAQSMQRAGAAYFTENPAAAETLETMAKAGLPYIVHEYMHEHWTPMYSARVAWEMAASDLHFAGVLPVHMNFRDTAVPESLEPLLEGVTDRVTFESLKDFAISEFFRRDVFVKGSMPRSAAAKSTYLDTTPWGSLANEPPAERTVKLPHRTVALAGSAFDVLFAALAEGATRLPVIAKRADAAGETLETLRAAMLRLVLAEHAIPMRAPTRSGDVRSERALAIPSVYNQMMLRRLATDTPLLLTSSVAGTAFPISALEGLALRVLTEAAAEHRETWVRDLVGRSVLRIRGADGVIEDRAEQERAILAAAAHLSTRPLGKLVELGVLAPSAA